MFVNGLYSPDTKTQTGSDVPEAENDSGKTLQAIVKIHCGCLLCQMKILQQADIREAVRYGITRKWKNTPYIDSWTGPFSAGCKISVMQRQVF